MLCDDHGVPEDQVITDPDSGFGGLTQQDSRIYNHPPVYFQVLRSAFHFSHPTITNTGKPARYIAA